MAIGEAIITGEAEVQSVQTMRDGEIVALFAGLLASLAGSVLCLLAV